MHSSVVANGYGYVLGGRDGSNVVQSTVYYAKLNTDGSTGAWQTNANAMPARYLHSSVVANGYVYVIGGFNGGRQSTVLYAKLNADGSTGAWQTNSYGIGATTPGGSAQARDSHTSIIANGYVYVIGGTTGTGQSTVYYARLNADGTTGAWTTNTNALPNLRSIHSSVVANGYAYVIGGYDDSANNSTVYYAKLNADGSTGTWSTSSNALPAIRQAHSSIMANGYIYTIAGSDGGAYRSTVYYTSTSRILAGGSLDLVGLGGQVLGDVGGTGGSITANNGTFVGDLQVQGVANFAQAVSIGQSLSVNG